MPRVLFFLHRLLDKDILLPILKQAIKNPNIQVSLCVSGSFKQKCPEVMLDLKKICQIQSVNHFQGLLGLTPHLSSVNTLITASESSACPHRLAFWVTKRANRLGIKTYTVQHGYENIGLTYFDEEYPPDRVSFASSTIFMWGNKEQLHPSVQEDIRNRCVPVGCPKEVLPVSAFKNSRPHHIGVFENLHWSRYSSGYKERFIRFLSQAAKRLPEVTFWVKPHPDHYQKAIRRYPPLNQNIKFVGPKTKNQPMDAVITTPSTVALDAARAGLPVAVVMEEKIASYEPLTVLSREEDWVSFVRSIDQADKREELIQKSKQFTTRVLYPGNAVENILRCIA